MLHFATWFSNTKLIITLDLDYMYISTKTRMIQKLKIRMWDKSCSLLATETVQVQTISSLWRGAWLPGSGGLGKVTIHCRKIQQWIQKKHFAIVVTTKSLTMCDAYLNRCLHRADEVFYESILLHEKK